MALKQWKRTAVVLLGVSLVGCKSGTDKTPVRMDSFLNRQSSSAGAAAGSGDLQAMSPQSVAALKTAGNGGQTSFGKVTAVMKDALTIDPRVSQSADPTDLAHDPGELQPKLYLSAAALYEQAGDLESAAEKYEQLLVIDSTHREGLVGYGRLKHRQGDLDGAIEVYRLAATQYGDDPIVLNDLGLCLARSGRSQEAVESLQAAIQLKPESLLYRNNLAAVLVEADRSNEAVTALEQSYGPAVAHYNVAYLLKQQGKGQDAIVHFNEALRLNPSMQPARIMLDQMAPQIGTLPQHLQRPSAGDKLRTSSRSPARRPGSVPISEPRVDPGTDAAMTPSNDLTRLGSRISSPSEVMPSVAIEHLKPVQAVIVPAEAEKVPSFVTQATFAQPLSPKIRQPETVATKAVEHRIRIPLSRKTKSKESSLVPPSPSELKSQRLPEFLPVQDD
ncbi:MAG: tetratricopeptide repeat protein [Pirellulaceae bacterium]|nr:tetratricopeptide repeat protein [Pirellulaceae bacterium]